MSADSSPHSEQSGDGDTLDVVAEMSARLDKSDAEFSRLYEQLTKLESLERQAWWKADHENRRAQSLEEQLEALRERAYLLEGVLELGGWYESEPGLWQLITTEGSSPAKERQ